MATETTTPPVVLPTENKKAKKLKIKQEKKSTGIKKPGRAKKDKNEKPKEAIILQKGLSHQGIRRLMRRTGIRRIQPHTYNIVQHMTREWMVKILSAANVFMEYGRRRTVTKEDVERALKFHARTSPLG